MSKLDIGTKVIIDRSHINFTTSHLVWCYGKGVSWFKSESDIKAYGSGDAQELDQEDLHKILFWITAKFSKTALLGKIIKRGSDCWLVSSKLKTKFGVIEIQDFIDEKHLKTTKTKSKRKSK